MTDELFFDEIAAYDYELPEALIAAHPSPARDASRLLVARREGETIGHRRFSEIVDLLGPRDLLVFNDTKVIPGRIMASKDTGGRVELLVLDVVAPVGEDRWQQVCGGQLEFECMTRTSKALRPGMILAARDAPVAFEVLDYEAGRARVRAQWKGSAIELLDVCGRMPLPPYIVQRRVEMGDEEVSHTDEDRYQTVYARRPGAIAAPTAGLHFTPPLLEALAEIGVRTAFVTLTVGPGTFQPVKAERLSEHTMHTEEYVIPEGLGDILASSRAQGGRVIAVGTTTMRALEAEARREVPFEPGVRQTDIFLKPGSRFHVCDGLITNFHLPRSTLLALVAGFVGYDFMRQIYREAIAEQYRFYSYGDASLLL
jgi:S-adenosylmethionine:tRNA ribosyltransferase-isomerase